MLSLIYWDRIVPFIQGLNSSESGFLLGVFRFFSVYFKDLDTWNIILTLILITFLLIGFIGLDLLIGKLFKLVKNPFMDFVHHDWFKLTIQKLLVGFFLLLCFTFLANIAIIYVGNQNTQTVSEVEKSPVLILGTNKHLSSKPEAENLYYTYRINTAIDLFKAGKVDYFIVSGDQTKAKNYDETLDMQNDLIAAGVPQKMIKRDTAGYRTLDSMLRLRSLFGLSNVIIVSQKFHVERALFLAWFYGMDAKAVAADGSSTIAMVQREILAKPKVILDLFVFNMQPKVGTYDYRNSFEVNSEASAWLILVLIIAILSVLWAFFNVLEQRTKGIGRKLLVAGCSTTGAVLLVIVVYKNTEIMDGTVAAIAENTGMLTEVVKAKEERKIEVEKEIKKIAETKVQLIKESDFTEEDTLTVELKEEVVEEDVKPVKKAEELFATISSSDYKPKEENEKKISEEKKSEEAEEENDIFSSIGGGGSTESFRRESGNSYSESKSTIYVKIHGTQSVSHDQKVRLRISEPVIISGKEIQKDFIFEGRVIIENSKVKITFTLNGKKGYIVNEYNENELSSTVYTLRENEYVLSSTKNQKALI